MRLVRTKLTSRYLLLLNFGIGVLLALIFTVSTFALSHGLYRERLAQTERIAEHFQKAFETEAGALDSLMYMCRDDAAFVSVVNSPNRDWSALSDYVSATVRQLKIMGGAFYAVNSFYLYSPTLDKIVSAEGYMDASLWVEAKWLTGRLGVGETAPDPATMTDGWHIYQNFSIYARRMSGGVLMAVVTPRYMAGLDDFSELYPGRHMVVLDSDGRLFASSLSDALDYASLMEAESVELSDGRYKVHRVDGRGFSYLLLTNAHALEQDYKRVNLTAVALSLTMAALLGALCCVNHAFVGGIRAAFGRQWDESASESAQIAKMIHERDDLRRRGLKALLRAAILAESEPWIQRTDLLDSGFASYVVVSLAVQSPDGPLEGDALESLIAFCEDSLPCCGVTAGPSRIVLLVEADRAAGETIERFAAGLEGDVCRYVGVSDEYTGSESLTKALRQAERRMLRAPVWGISRAVSDSAASEAALADADRAQLRAVCEGGDAREIESFLRALIARSASLGDMQELGAELLRAMDARDACDSGECFHPEYLCGRLTETALSLREPVLSAAQEAMRQAVLSYLDERYMEDVSLDSVASRFHVTPMHLSRWFKKVNGVNFSVYLSTLRMKKAQQLLCDEKGLKISEVAAMVGLPNAPTFTRQFKGFTGMTPEQFRHMGGKMNQ